MISIHEMIKGGIPVGQLAMFCGSGPRADSEFGPKSSISLELIKHAMDNGKQVLFLNLEGSIDPEWLSAIGINNQEK